MSADRFRYYLRVRYQECDAQRVVFNSRYSDYVGIATSEYLRALGFEKEMQSGELEYQLVRQTLEWKAPARYDQVLEVSIATRSIGVTSFALRAEFRIAGDVRLIVTVETVYVHVDLHSHTKQPVPQRLREVLTRGAAGTIVDHAAHLARST